MPWKYFVVVLNQTPVQTVHILKCTNQNNPVPWADWRFWISGRFPFFHFLHTCTFPFYHLIVMHNFLSFSWQVFSMTCLCRLLQKTSLLPSSGQICASLTYCIACSSSFSIVLLSLLYSSAWLTGYEDPMIDKINQRIEDLTGLEMDTAEELQVKRSLVEGRGHSTQFYIWFHFL